MMPFAPRFVLYTTALAGTVLLTALGCWQPGLLPFLSVPLAAFAGFAVLGTVDLLPDPAGCPAQLSDLAHLRFMLEKIWPEMRQYFFEFRQAKS
jgi:hypothetical protein